MGGQTLCALERLDGLQRGGLHVLPQQLINHRRMPRQMLDDMPDPRRLLETTFRGTQSDQLAWAVPKAESAAEGVALILASGDFNRR